MILRFRVSGFRGSVTGLGSDFGRFRWQGFWSLGVGSMDLLVLFVLDLFVLSELPTTRKLL